MNYLFDIGHPADFYLFKNVAIELIKKGHKVKFTVRLGENEDRHLKAFKIDYTIIGGKESGLIQKALKVLIFTFNILRVAIKFKPDIFISHGSLFAGLAAYVLRKPHIAMEDTGNMEQIRLSKPFSNVILSPDVLSINLGPKHIRYNGYHEISYLSPKYYRPNPDIYNYLGINKYEAYTIIRFISWGATHDKGEKGLDFYDKLKIVEYLTQKMHVFISAEGKIDNALKKYKIQIPVNKMHDALAFATIYVGEGCTMAAEAGLLGTPSLFINSQKRDYLIDQQKYGTVINLGLANAPTVLNAIDNLLNDPTTKQKFKHKAKNIFTDKIEVADFFIWFIENYPSSKYSMNTNPNYQYHFK